VVKGAGNPTIALRSATPPGGSNNPDVREDHGAGGGNRDRPVTSRAGAGVVHPTGAGVLRSPYDAAAVACSTCARARRSRRDTCICE
jgi:hypothetical protein